MLFSYAVHHFLYCFPELHPTSYQCLSPLMLSKKRKLSMASSMQRFQKAYSKASLIFLKQRRTLIGGGVTTKEFFRVSLLPNYGRPRKMFTFTVPFEKT